MQETLSIVGAAFGGLGIFILAIGLMTDGLKMAAGNSLRKILSGWSKTTLRGIFSGFLMTSIVQSSSAVTVASIGFVNAGLIKMRQAMGIVYGANVGTTMTAWLVAITGFKLNLGAVALPMIGLGMVLKLASKKERIASMGLALVGFGLFFIGIDVLKDAFSDVVNAFDISGLDANGILGVISFLLAGIVMTVLTQSSSASIAITITAAASGIIGLPAAATMSIGAFIGTTSTAVFAAIGATTNAKRLAAVHVIFSLITGAAALMLLPAIFWIAEGNLDLESNIAVTIAVFLTVFKTIGVLIIYPLNNKLADFVERRFTSKTEQEAALTYLDDNIATTPTLAVNALVNELKAIGEKVSKLYSDVVNGADSNAQEIERQKTVIFKLCGKVSDFVVKMEKAPMSEATTEHLATLMRVNQYLVSSASVAYRLSLNEAFGKKIDNEQLSDEVSNYFKNVLAFVNGEHFNQMTDVDRVSEQFDALEKEHDDVKSQLLLATTQGHVAIDHTTDLVECLIESKRLAKFWLKAEKRINAMQFVLLTDQEKSDFLEKAELETDH